ncbi:MBL fold metallo-hydrolase [Ohtaekwangia sp.]|uniref:MBL fold metallo-hydrolase n=1 Tax=Ohtaekwangia sp. TaxID=2066019 RepID=UPI002FDDA1D7
MMPDDFTSSYYLVKDTSHVKVHSFVSPGSMFANATHIIELPTQLILIDGQFFAQYAQEFRKLANGLNKPITRFYITHDHPDHYLGMGDAFPDVTVYALPEIKDAINHRGNHELTDKQHHFGSLIATRLNYPSITVEPGVEWIDGVQFVFERVLNTESPVTLVIKLPDLAIAIVQDILYHNTHAFIAAPVAEWVAALQRLQHEPYNIFLPGHGIPAGKADIDNAISYLQKAYDIFLKATTEEAYKQSLLKIYTHYAGAKLIDIYLPLLFRNKEVAATHPD